MPKLATNLIVFGEDWGGLPSSTQHLIRNMPDRGNVLWFNSIGLRAPTFSVADLKRVVAKLQARRTADQNEKTAYSSAPLPPRMQVAEPKVLPVHQNQIVRRHNARQLIKQADDFISACADNPPTIWVTVPTAACFVEAMPQLPSIYYCCDDFGTLPGVDHKTALQAEQSLGANADLVVVTNELLANKFPPDKTIYVPQGVDIDLFTTAVPPAADLPAGKIAGFFGLIAEWVDQDLIVETARALHDEGWQIVIIGNANVDTSRLEAQPNIHLLGPRPYDQLPHYAQHWDVSLLPFADTPEVRASNPLKLREYLAAGQTIVSTPFPAADPYAANLSLAATADRFINAVRSYDNSTDAVSRRRNSIANESWAARGQQITDALGNRGR